jgi:hypothetical protein
MQELPRRSRAERRHSTSAKRFARLPEAKVTSGLENWISDSSPPEAAVAPPKIELGYRPFPKQRDFHASRAKYRLFGGAAGPGMGHSYISPEMDLLEFPHVSPLSWLIRHNRNGASTLILICVTLNLDA